MVCWIYQPVDGCICDLLYNTLIIIVSDPTASRCKMSNEFEKIWKTRMWPNRGTNPKFAWKDTGNPIKNLSQNNRFRI
jgi:hypothetical protein